MTPIDRDIFAALALADAASLLWPTAQPCTHLLGTLPCTRTEPHAGGGRGCVHLGSGVPQVNDTEHRE